MEIYSSLLLEAAPVPEDVFLKQKIPVKKTSSRDKLAIAT